MTTSGMQFAGERRQVTALFYDIVGSTELLSHTDPEEFFRSVASVHKLSEAVVVRHGGYLHQKLGDGGCCYFGYPEQSEDTAARAVQASLELLDVVGRQRHGSQKVLFKLRVGVATSVVIFSADGNIIGAAPVLAARLQAEAQPDSVLVEDAAFQLTRGRFDYTFLRDVKLKGFDNPIPIWRPHSTIKAPDRFSLHLKSGAPMKGREQELRVLLRAWHDTCKGTGKSVVIEGDAGIGKSRLVLEFRRQLQREDNEDIILQCSASLTSQPLHPFIGFLESMVGRHSQQGFDRRLLRGALRIAGLDASADTAEIMADFTSEKSRSTSGNIRFTDVSGRAFRKKVIDAAIEILTSNASGHPKLIVVEDVHWADNMTAELLASLNDRVGILRVLVIQTSRVPVANAAIEKVTLMGLGPSAMGELVSSAWGAEPPRGLSSFILEQCDGMPLYAEELVHFLKTRHASSDTAREWRNLLIDGGVSSLNDLLAAKLSEVGSARRAAQLASVIGREFNSDLLKHLSSDVETYSLDTDLSALVIHGVIERKTSPVNTYQFRHMLLHEAAYASLLRSDRRQIHERIARILIEEDVPSLPAAITAWQCAEAGRHLDAARFALKAGEASVLRSAMQEASQSLDLCAREIGVISPRTARAELTLDLLQLQAVVSTALEGEGAPQARRIYSRAMSLVRGSPSAKQEDRFPIYWGWWFTAPNIMTQQSRARILVEDMKHAEDPETRLQSYHCAWATGFHAAQHSFCLSCVLNGIGLYDAERAKRTRAFFGGHDAKVCGLGESALSYLLTNEVEASEAAIAQCLEWAVIVDHVGSMVHALYYAMVLRCCQGRYDEVHRLAEQMLRLAVQDGLAASQARANMYCGWAQLMSSSFKQGEQRFQEGLIMHQQIGGDENFSIHSDMHSQILQRLGRPAEAMGVVDTAIALGRKRGQLFWLAELYRRRAELRRELGGKPSQIGADLRRSIQTSESQGAIWLAARAKLDLQRLMA